MFTLTSEQGQTNLATRTKSRSDTYRLRASATLSEVDDGKKISVEVATTPIVLTLAPAVRCVGCEIEGIVAVSTGQTSLTITGALPAQLRFTGTPALVAGVNTLAGQPLVLPNVVAGAWFRAVSTGLRWHVTVTNPAATAAGGITVPQVITITQNRTLTPVETNNIVEVDLVSNNITLTLPDASLATGATLRGVVVRNLPLFNFTLTCAVPQQIIGAAAFPDADPSASVQVFQGQPLAMPLVEVGSLFQAYSTGTRWLVSATGKISP